MLSADFSPAAADACFGFSHHSPEVRTRRRRSIAATDLARCSFWLETAGDDLTQRARLDGGTSVDVAMLREHAVAWFPILKDVGFSHAWGGPLGAPRDWTPTIASSP